MKKMTPEEIRGMAEQVYPQLLAMAPKRAAYLRDQNDPDRSPKRILSEVLVAFAKRAGWGDPPTNHPVFQALRETLFDENGDVRSEASPDVIEAIGEDPSSSPGTGQSSAPQGTSSLPASGAPSGPHASSHAAAVDGSSGSAPTPSSPPSAPAVPSAPARPSMPLAAQMMAALRAQMRLHFLEREGVIDSLLIATAAGEHLLLIGPPGTAKSALAKALARAASTEAFIRLLTRHTKTEEVFGPLSISDLREGRYVVLTEGYLPSAKVAVLDEIFKCNSAILNALLTILNEREYDNGRTRERVPLHIVIGASNELPEDESLAALYDRFMLRHWVPAVSPTNLPRLLAMNGAPEDQITAQVDLDELKSLAARTVVGPDVLEAILMLRNKLAAKETSIFASDRRWRKAVGLVQAAAVLRGAVGGPHLWNPDGTMTAIPADIAVLSHVLWDLPDDAPKVQSAVMSVIASVKGTSPAPKPAAPKSAPPPANTKPSPPKTPTPQPASTSPAPTTPNPPANPTAPGGAWSNLPQQAYGGNNAPPAKKPRAASRPAAPAGPTPAQQRAQAAMKGQVTGDVIRDEIGGMSVQTAFSRVREYVSAGTALHTLLPALEALNRKCGSDRTVPYAQQRQVREWLNEARKPPAPPPAAAIPLVPDATPAAATSASPLAPGPNNNGS